ncbi:type 4a pilus biogenesis protein PilO [bacterium]|nr:type 4a pilus biogenesis protein PilO [bacterium]
MKKVFILLAIAVVFGGGFWAYYNLSYPKFPERISALDRELKQKNEKLISAEIISQEMDLVASLIERNLALSARDSLAEDASMPFLNFVTNLLDELDIKLMSMEPKKRRTQVDHIKTPYSMSVECSYSQFGQLITQLEKSERLITVESFMIDNGYRKAQARQKGADPDKHLIELEISTLTLIKRN